MKQTKKVKIEFIISKDFLKNNKFFNWLSKCPVEAQEIVNKKIK